MSGERKGFEPHPVLSPEELIKTKHEYVKVRFPYRGPCRGEKT